MLLCCCIPFGLCDWQTRVSEKKLALSLFFKYLLDSQWAYWSEIYSCWAADCQIFSMTTLPYFHRIFHTQWWPSKGDCCCFRDLRRKVLEDAFGGKLLGVHEIRRGWYGKHWKSSRWRHHSCTFPETGSDWIFFFSLCCLISPLVCMIGSTCVCLNISSHHVHLGDV